MILVCNFFCVLHEFCTFDMVSYNKEVVKLAFLFVYWHFDWHLDCNFFGVCFMNFALLTWSHSTRRWLNWHSCLLTDILFGTWIAIFF